MERAKAYFKELLNDIVAKHVHHELVGGLEDLIEDKLTLSGCGTLKFQLNESEIQRKRAITAFQEDLEINENWLSL